MNDDNLAELSMQLVCDWLKCDNVNPNVAFDSLNDTLSLKIKKSNQIKLFLFITLVMIFKYNS